MKANLKIHKAMQENERAVLSHIRQFEKDGGHGWHPFLINIPWRNATKRLEEKGKIKFSRRHHGYIVVR